jgi:hypothetical protein
VDEGLTKIEVSQALDVSINTVTNVCRFFQEQRLEAIERKKPAREYEHRLDAEAEAHLIAIACSVPPEGRELVGLSCIRGSKALEKHSYPEKRIGSQVYGNRFLSVSADAN